MNAPDLNKYCTFVFDCDGVILNSNALKSEAFFQSAVIFGVPEAKALVDYHVKNGGVSRYEKFRYFLREILNIPFDDSIFARLLTSYESYVWSALIRCEISSGLIPLREKYPDSKWLVVSGGSQEELRKLFNYRHIFNYFDGGIFGSPDDKVSILNREVSGKNILYPAVFFGDSRYDYEAAKRVKLDFIFISQWTELENWESWVNLNRVVHAHSLDSLV